MSRLERLVGWARRTVGRQDADQHVPVSTTDLMGMDELYVVILDQEWVSKKVSSSPRLSQLLQGRAVRDTIGMVYEVVSRGPNIVTAYILCDVASVRNADRQLVAQGVGCDHGMHDFLFTVERTTMGAGLGPVYGGSLVRYDFARGMPQENAQPEQVTLALPLAPTSKHRTVLHNSCGVFSFPGQTISSSSSCPYSSPTP